VPVGNYITIGNCFGDYRHHGIKFYVQGWLVQVLSMCCNCDSDFGLSEPDSRNKEKYTI